MKPLPKPEAFTPRVGSWVDPEYLPARLRAELRGLLPSKLHGDRAEAFLTACAEWAQYLNENRHSVPIAARVAQLEKVADCARNLQYALRSMAPETVSAFGVAVDALTLVRAPAIKLTGAAAASRVPFAEQRFLGVAWDYVSDLESVARHAIARANPSKQGKVSTANARTLIYCLIRAYQAIFGELPPSSKGGWFVGFVGHLAAWDRLALTCGPALVQAVFREAFAGASSPLDEST